MDPAQESAQESLRLDVEAPQEEGSPVKNAVNAAPRPRPSLLRRVGPAVDYGLLSFLGRLASFVARHPRAVLLGCLLLATCCGAGIRGSELESDAEDCYAHLQARIHGQG